MHQSKVTLSKGGTRTAVEIAKKYNVPVFNLAEPEVFEKFKKHVEGEQ